MMPLLALTSFFTMLASFTMTVLSCIMTFRSWPPAVFSDVILPIAFAFILPETT